MSFIFETPDGFKNETMQHVVSIMEHCLPISLTCIPPRISVYSSFFIISFKPLRNLPWPFSPLLAFYLSRPSSTFGIDIATQKNQETLRYA